MNKYLLIILLNTILIQTLLSKNLDNYDNKLFKDNFFIGQEFAPKKEILAKHNNFHPIWVSLLEVVTFNTVLTSFDYYVLGRDTSLISYETVRDNFRHGFDWDTDLLRTNFFLHPMQGSIYYNTARANGFSVEHSYFVSLLGSLQWEYFMEVMPPSFNDLIITSISGSFLGEVFFQITSLILDDSSTGFNRAFRELISGVIAPGRFFTRITNGSAYKHNKYKIYPKKKYKFNLALGVNNLSNDNSNDFLDRTPELLLIIRFEHGNPFLVKKIKFLKFFNLRASFKAIKSSRDSPLTIFNVNGILYGFHFKSKDNNHNLILSFNQYFDYYNTYMYRIGALKYGPTLRYRSKISSLFGIETILGITGIPMAGILSSYSKYNLVERINRSKEYNTSWGGSINYSITLKTKYIGLKLDYIFWVLRTFSNKGAGILGTEISSMLKPSIEININRVSFNFEYLYYHNEGKYNNFPDTKKYINEIRFILGYNF